MRKTKNVLSSEAVCSIFFTGSPFPFGQAAANRQRTIAKGISESSAKVFVYCFAPTSYPTNGNKFQRKGVLGNIEWRYTTPIIKKPNGRLLFYSAIIIGVIVAFVLILNKFILNRSKKFIFVNFTDIRYLTFAWVLKNIIHAKLVFFRSELPLAVIRESSSSFLFEKYLFPITLKAFDLMFLMTNELVKYYSKFKNKKCTTHIVPVTIEPERFEKNKVGRVLNYRYIAYCGGLHSQKDGLDILIKAFSRIEKKYDGLHLVIVGSGPEKEEQALRNLVKRVISEPNRVVFIGYVSGAEVPKYICHADALLLARPDSVQARGGFPSKVAEYLCTGNPIVVTNTGEITKYLQHEKHAFISEPNSVFDFSTKMEKCIIDTDKAKTIGEIGKIKAVNTFGYQKIGNDVFEVLIGS